MGAHIDAPWDKPLAECKIDVKNLTYLAIPITIRPKTPGPVHPEANAGNAPGPLVLDLHAMWGIAVHFIIGVCYLQGRKVPHG